MYIVFHWMQYLFFNLYYLPLNDFDKKLYIYLNQSLFQSSQSLDSNFGHSYFNFYCMLGKSEIRNFLLAEN